MYDAKDYTLHTYKDSVRMDKLLLVCINKVKHKEPVFFSTADEMKAHWQPCLDLTLVAKPAAAQAARGRGKGRTPQAKVNGSKAGTSAQVEAGTSSQVDTTKAGSSTQVDISDIQMQDVEEIILAESESAD